MSQSGICSRRKAEEYIVAGLVLVNGVPATLGQSIDPNVDKIVYNDKLVTDTKELVYYKLNKPRGVVTTCKQDGEIAIVDIVDIATRVFPIGRLDKETTGLILLTNDGRLSNFLMHPRYAHEKEYVVDVYGNIDDEALQTLSQGVVILGKKTKSTTVKRLAAGRFSIVLTEGMNRQIRRMVRSIGKEVKKLKRIRIENIYLGNLEIGEYVSLSEKEKRTLFAKIDANKTS